MDTKETLIKESSTTNRLLTFSQFPILGLILALITCVVFYLSHSHDQKVWQQLFIYHSNHLLKTEAPLYEDFYNKRLSIEKVGSEKELASIQEAIKSKHKEQLSAFILSDRSFRIFLEKKAPIYFSPNERTYWLTHNKIVAQTLESLYAYQLGLIPERFITSPKIANLLSYIFIDEQIINVLSNLILLLLLCIIIERYVKRAYLAGFIISFSLVYASLYLSIADSFSKPLFGLNGLIYILSALITSIFIQTYFKTRFHRKKLYLIIGTLLICLKIACDVFFQTMSVAGLYALLPLCILGLIFASILYQFACRNIGVTTVQTTLPALSESTRADYEEALKGLSRFNFKYARQKLRLLIEEEPSSQRIMESSYHLEKLSPEDSIFGQLAQSRIDDALIRQDYLTVRSIFQDIQRSAPTRNAAKKHISADYYLKMLVLFLQHNDFEKAEHVFMFLELAGQKILVQEACKLLIESFTDKQLLKKKTHYQALYQNYLIDK